MALIALSKLNASGEETGQVIELMRELRKQIVTGELLAVGFSPPRCVKSHRLLTVAG